MAYVQDFLEFHNLDAATCEDILAACRAGVISDAPPVEGSTGEAGVSANLADLHSCLIDFVGPALETVLGTTEAGEPVVARLLDAVSWEILEPSGSARPCTEDRGADRPPLVRMTWRGRAEDLLCLAHEAAHALQILLSRGGTMPPIARECCAFLGEIALLDRARRVAPDLASQLRAVWQAETETYLGTDCDRLTAALRDPRSPYAYRLNYPLARLAAVAMAAQGPGPWPYDLFSSGSGGMDRLPLAALAAEAARISNPLPPVPEAEPDLRALGTYRTLGAMVALDIEAWNERTETPIGDYHADCLRAAKDGLLIALDGDRRPFGYATWTGEGAGPADVFTHLTAPFGRHGELRRRVAARGAMAAEA